MLDPMTFPSAIALFSLRFAYSEAANSGTLVPNATTVAPMKNGESFILLAMATDAVTRKCAPPMRTEPPRIIAIKETSAGYVERSRFMCLVGVYGRDLTVVGRYHGQLNCPGYPTTE